MPLLLLPTASRGQKELIRLSDNDNDNDNDNAAPRDPKSTLQTHEGFITKECMENSNPKTVRVAIAGASGFVGQALRSKLLENYSVIALGRNPPKEKIESRLEWRTVDLYSAGSVAEALKDADVGIYLVHSMMPSSRLFQGDFHDTDLLLADNFANACRLNKVKQIIYLGGLLPEGFVSSHLQSRYEVENVLKTSGIDVTVFRSGMIVGAGGSSFEILRSLVKKLPLMVLPKWTARNTQAVFIDDVVRVIEASILSPIFKGKTWDLVNGESLTYKTLLEKTAQFLGKNRWMIPVPIASTGFSKLWVQIFGNSPKELVSPLIDSLVCDLPQLQPAPELEPLIYFKSYASMFRKANLGFEIESGLEHGLEHGQSREPNAKFSSKKTPNLNQSLSQSPQKQKKKKRPMDASVRSIQRLPAIDRDAHWLAMEYMNWLPSFFPLLLRVEIKEQENKVNFHFRFFSKPLLELTFVKNSLDLQREKFHITGGILTKTTNTGWLEFRQLDHKKTTLVSIHGFYPSLPWIIYRFTQAPLHKIVMHSFGRHLERMAPAKSATSSHGQTSNSRISRNV